LTNKDCQIIVKEMRKFLFGFILIFFSVIVFVACDDLPIPTSTPPGTESATPTAKVTSTPSGTAESSGTVGPDPSPTPPPTETPSPTATPTPPPEVIVPQLLNNGDFSDISGEIYPKNVNNWSHRAAGSGSYVAPSTEDDVQSGAVNVSAGEWGDVKDLIGNPVNPGKPCGAESNDILMIRNINKTAYYYTSSTVTMTAGKYYKVTVNVLTYIDGGQPGVGANLFVMNGAYSGFYNINTEGVWKTYTTYIEANKMQSQSIYLELWFGYGDNTTAGKETHVSGYTFFSNIRVEQISGADYKNSTPAENVARYNMNLPNAEFDYFSVSTYYPKYPTKFSAYSEGTSSTSYLSAGVINVDPVIFETTKKNFSQSEMIDSVLTYTLQNPGSAPGSIGDNVLMINNKNITAYGYKSTQSMPILPFSYSKISFWVNTANVSYGSGAYVYFKGMEDLSFEGIDTSGNWEQYSFFIENISSQTKEYNIEFWMGREDSLVRGTAFFDSLSITEYENPSDYNAAIAAAGAKGQAVTLSRPSKISSSLEEWQYYGESPIDDSVRTEIVTLENGRIYDGHGMDITSELLLTAGEVKALPRDNRAILIWNQDTGGSSYTYGSGSIDANGDIVNDLIRIKKNHFYRFSIWVRTLDIEEGGINIYLKRLNYGDEQILTLISNANTYGNELNNGWMELIFYIAGNELADNYISVQITFGKADNTVKGYAFISNPYLEEITFYEWDYNKTGGVNIKGYTFSGVQPTILNGAFNLPDFTDESTLIDADGNLIYPAKPRHWSSVGNFGVTDVVSGIVDKGVIDNIQSDFSFPGVHPYPDSPIGADGRPNALLIWNRTAQASGYSVNHTLSAQSFYRLSIDVYTSGTGGVAVQLKNYQSGNVAAKLPIGFYGIETSASTGGDNGDGWVRYYFYIETGMWAVPVNIGLLLGTSDAKTTGYVYYDNIWLLNITDEEFNLASESGTVKIITYVTDTFELNMTNPSYYPVAPQNWKGSPTDSYAPVGYDCVIAGIINAANYDIQTKSYLDGLDISDIWTAADDMISGGDMLMIYNKEKTGYFYTNATSIILNSNEFYYMSVWVNTYGIEGEGARISLVFGTERCEFKGINTETNGDGWTKYEFYISLEDFPASIGIFLELGLGSKAESGENYDMRYTSGYAAFDDVTIQRIEKTVFDGATASDTIQKIQVVIAV